jgi:hypothetical protein
MSKKTKPKVQDYFTEEERNQLDKEYALLPEPERMVIGYIAGKGPYKDLIRRAVVKARRGFPPKSPVTPPDPKIFEMKGTLTKEDGVERPASLYLCGLCVEQWQQDSEKVILHSLDPARHCCQHVQHLLENPAVEPDPADPGDSRISGSRIDPNNKFNFDA